MVQGLGFLSKKSWHTKNIANQEKVWIAEERQKTEERKTKELAKQIAQEREQEELDRIAGKKTADRGIDWMYQGQNQDSEIAKEDANKQAEEYLLGKEFVGDGAVKGDLDDGTANEGINKVVAVAAPEPEPELNRPHEPTVAERNEASRMRLEDPMFAVSKQAYEMKQKYEKKKELYEKVTGEVAVDAHKARKESKKRKKEKRHKKHRRDRDDDGRRREDRQRSSRRRHRSRSPSESEDSRRHSRRRRRSRSHSRSYSRERDSYRRSRSRNQSPARRDYDDRRGSYRGEVGSYRHDNDGRRYSSHDDRDYRRGRSPDRQGEAHRPVEPWHDHRHHQKKAGYGLQGGASRPTATRPGDLGPDQELLRRKHEEKEAERRQLREAASSRRHMSAAERAAALRAMEADAQRREQTRDRISVRDGQEESAARGQGANGAAFLHDITRKAHGLHDGAMSMTERLKQNRNSNQKAHESFL